MSENDEFEWDARKDKLNQEKHGVSFQQARQAFEDPERIIVRDKTDSTQKEERLYCIGQVANGILMVRFTYRENRIRIIGAGFWRQGRNSMKKETKEIVEYSDNPELGELEIIEDFLPSPERLAKADQVVKVTIGLSQESIDFFKKHAAKHNTSYQRMIRRLLDEYVAQVRSVEGQK
jgi:uncharacterized DUF497 family protein